MLTLAPSKDHPFARPQIYIVIALKPIMLIHQKWLIFLLFVDLSLKIFEKILTVT